MKPIKKLNFNYLIADIVSQMNLGIIRRLRFIKMIRTRIALRILTILYRQGVIRYFQVNGPYIHIYFKYVKGRSVCEKISIISKPSKRERWTLKKLSKKYSNTNFSGFYIITTQKGLVSVEYALLYGHMSGEVLIKVEI
jgi:ribosomal protein S8